MRLPVGASPIIDPWCVATAELRSITRSSEAIRSSSVTTTSRNARFIMIPTCLKPSKPVGSAARKWCTKFLVSKRWPTPSTLCSFLNIFVNSLITFLFFSSCIAFSLLWAISEKQNKPPNTEWAKNLGKSHQRAHMTVVDIRTGVCHWLRRSSIVILQHRFCRRIVNSHNFPRNAEELSAPIWLPLGVAMGDRTVANLEGLECASEDF